MKRLFKQIFIALIILPLAAAVVALAVANRQEVAIYLDPFANPPQEGLQVGAPLFAVVLGAVMVGILLGGVATYFEQAKYRRAARRVRRELALLQKEIARLSPARVERKAS
jgi:uncharacterized integral membrane protein